MARPAKNFAVSKGIVVGISVSVMGFPCALAHHPPIIPRQILLATFAVPVSYSPTILYHAIWKSYFAPPVRVKGNYTTILKNVNTLKEVAWTWGWVCLYG